MFRRYEKYHLNKSYEKSLGFWTGDIFIVYTDIQYLLVEKLPYTEISVVISCSLRIILDVIISMRVLGLSLRDLYND